MNMKNVFLFVGLLALTSCSSVQIKRAEIQKKEQPKTSVTPAPQTQPSEAQLATEVPEEVVQEKPKIGLILGPGAIRAYAHIGVLQEFSKSKIPIHSIAGVEMGSLVGAIYSNKGQAYDVEWQMFKMKEEDLIQKTFVSGALKPLDVGTLQPYLQTILGSAKVEEAKIPFACPALNLAKNQTYMMTKGAYTQMLPYCLPFAPLFQPYSQNVAAMADLAATARYLKSKGATYLVYINLLPQQGGMVMDKKEILHASSWAALAQGIENQFQFVDKIVNIQVSQYTLTDFAKRREIMLKGQEAGRAAATQIIDQFGF